MVVARSLHPEYRDVLRTYGKNSGLHMEEIPWDRTAPSIKMRLKSMLIGTMLARSLCNRRIFLARLSMCRGWPNKFIPRERCWLLPSPKASRSAWCGRHAEADIVAMEGQSFGLAPSYGGPFVGVIASRDKFVRQMPGRLAGQTIDTKARRGLF